ncbi:MAG: ribose 5-phosphate isomerase B [Lachnospiraceae bacterium]|nr:ribose 5-phosphate isomerase B [Lachnospiraceae bacterium]
MENKKVVIGCDHGAYQLKLTVKEHLASLGYEIIDVGTDSEASCDYPIYANALCDAIRSGKAPLGILLCGTGIGMSIAANKHKGIRAALCSDTFSARLTRNHNDANVLCIGARVVGPGLAVDIVDSFLNAKFEGGRHERRVNMLKEIEENEK